MLTSLLLTSVALLPFAQDAAPTELAVTDPAVRAFMSDIQARLYMPEQKGLASLAFDVDFEQPMIGKVATAHTRWAAEAGASVTVDTLEFEVPEELAQRYGADSASIKQQIVQSAPQLYSLQGEQLVDNVLNRFVSDMLDDYVAALDGASADGLVKVGLTSKPGSNAEYEQATLFVDDESVLQRLESTLSTPEQAVPFTIQFFWKAASDTEAGLVFDRWEITVKFPTPMGEMEQKTIQDYGYRNVRDLVILESITTTMKMPAMMGMPDQVQRNVLRYLAVNGEALPTAAVESAEG